MEIINKKVKDLIPYENNPRNNEDSVKYVANSIKEFGFKVPIVVDKDNVIVAGHTRLLAAIDLGMEEVPCIVADDLSEEQVKAFRLADNKVSEFSLWDYDKLGLEKELIPNIDLTKFGFDDINLDISYIDDLMTNEFAGTSENSEFTITFSINKDYEEQVMNYIKEQGKDKIVDKILEMAGVEK